MEHQDLLAFFWEWSPLGYKTRTHSWCLLVCPLAMLLEWYLRFNIFPQSFGRGHLFWIKQSSLTLFKLLATQSSRGMVLESPLSLAILKRRRGASSDRFGAPRGYQYNLQSSSFSHLSDKNHLSMLKGGSARHHICQQNLRGNVEKLHTSHRKVSSVELGAWYYWTTFPYVYVYIKYQN